MTGSSHKYAMLMVSLPGHPKNFIVAKNPPISRLKLNQRLSMLEIEDAQTLSVVESILHWDHLSLKINDEEVVSKSWQLINVIKNPFVKSLILWRLELRTVVAALRRRHLGLATPHKYEVWGFGPWTRRIIKFWDEPYFCLESVYPWIVEVEQHFKNDNPFELEKYVLSLVWDYYSRNINNHYFNFEGVVLYILRWHVIDRWSRYDGAAAQSRFEELVNLGLENCVWEKV